jgi:SLIT-ROBO Rho GTPase activating protein
MYLSAQENLKRSRQLSIDNLSRSVGDLDSNADKLNYLDYYSFVFNIQKRFQFEPHKGDEVSQVNAQSLIRYEMEKRFNQLDSRLKTLKTENDEIFKTIEATEQSLLNYFDLKNCDMSDLFRDLNLVKTNSAQSKEKRIEIEDYYVEKVRQYTISNNLIARLEARHNMMNKALTGCVNSSEDKSLEKLITAANMDLSSSQRIKKKKIGKSPLIGQPRLFGGKLIEYMNVTKQDIPQIITSCIKAINRLGLHNQGIFRVPGSQLEINQFKEAFEKGEDPLITVNPREMNSVAGVLKLYLRELKDPLFPREMYDVFVNCMRSRSEAINPVAFLSLTPSSTSALVDETKSNENSLPKENTLQPPTSVSNSASLYSNENLDSEKVQSIKKAVQSLPKPIYIILRYLFAFLNQ